MDQLTCDKCHFYVKVIRKDQPLPVDSSSTGTSDFTEDSATGLVTRTWRDVPVVAYELLIIGSFGKMSVSQTIQVAHKLIPSDQEGSNQWMTEEIDLIRKLNEKASNCSYCTVYLDLPGNEQSKDCCLNKIRNFFTNCKEMASRWSIYSIIYMYCPEILNINRN